MEHVGKRWEVVIFTASQRVYAEQLLNILDPGQKHIRHRIFRDSCVYVDGNYLKDLSVRLWPHDASAHSWSWDFAPQVTVPAPARQVTGSASRRYNPPSSMVAAISPAGPGARPGTHGHCGQLAAGIRLPD